MARKNQKIIRHLQQQFLLSDDKIIMDSSIAQKYDENYEKVLLTHSLVL